ncbi:hypothetical protein Tco_0126325, partial [Tanacetum coccineum]
REEIDMYFGPDDSILPGIESDDFNSEDNDNSTSFPEFESFHVDYPDSGDSTVDVVEDKVFNHGVHASKEISPPSSSHQGFKASKLSLHKSPMLIHRDNTPNLGVRHPHFYPP